MRLTPLGAMIAKDLRLFLTDRRALMMAFAAPIVIASFFGAIFSSVHGMAERARLAIYVVDRDRSPIARAIVAAVEDDRNLSVTVTRDHDEAWMAVRRGTAMAAVIIPPGFGEEAGRAFFGAQVRPQLKFLYDPTRGVELAMVRGIVTEHVMRSISRELWAGHVTLPYEIHEQAVTAGASAPYNSYAHAFAGMGVQFLLFAAVDLGIGILLDRQRGVWKRIRSAPLSRALVLGGKAASGAIITLLTLLVSFAFAMLVFKVRIEGSTLGFLSVSVACALMATTFGLLIAAIGGTPAATRGVATFAVLVVVMLGGAWVPTFIFPAWLQKLTMVVPVRWAMDGLDGMTWRGLPLAAAVTPTLVLLGFSLLFGLLALLKFRWNE
jgi:ABC-type multidrug transport system permease subunit